MSQKNVEAYIKNYNVCLSSKTVIHKFYTKLQALPVLINKSKNFSIDFIIELPISTN